MRKLEVSEFGGRDNDELLGGLLTGSGRQSMPLKTLKMAVFAPMAEAKREHGDQRSSRGS